MEPALTVHKAEAGPGGVAALCERLAAGDDVSHYWARVTCRRCLRRVPARVQERTQDDDGGRQ